MLAAITPLRSAQALPGAQSARLGRARDDCWVLLLRPSPSPPSSLLIAAEVVVIDAPQRPGLVLSHHVQALLRPHRRCRCERASHNH
jgi:hypothetical protein